MSSCIPSELERAGNLKPVGRQAIAPEHQPISPSAIISSHRHGFRAEALGDTPIM
jgi:hypothetical protein